MALLAVLVDVVTLVAIVAAAIVLRNVIPTYFTEKAKNLATREDIEGITRKIERVRAEYTSTAESLRAELRVAAHERETRFARSHERRADALMACTSRSSGHTPLFCR